MRESWQLCDNIISVTTIASALRKRYLANEGYFVPRPFSLTLLRLL